MKLDEGAILECFGSHSTAELWAKVPHAITDSCTFAYEAYRSLNNGNIGVHGIEPLYDIDGEPYVEEVDVESELRLWSTDKNIDHMKQCIGGKIDGTFTAFIPLDTKKSILEALTDAAWKFDGRMYEHYAALTTAAAYIEQINNIYIPLSPELYYIMVAAATSEWIDNFNMILDSNGISHTTLNN